MLSIVYISSATPPFSEAALSALLEQSRKNNARLQITGILLYKDGDIMQLLEGPEPALRELMKTIYSDRRHTGVIQLLEQEISARQFPDWSLEFRNLSPSKLRRLATYLNDSPGTHLPENSRQSPALRLLATFGFKPGPDFFQRSSTDQSDS